MKHTPKSIDLKEIATEARTIKGVKSIYHIHAWQLDDHDIVFEAHVELEENIRINEFEIIAKEIHNILAKHHVFHATLQPEFEAEKTEILFNRTEVCKRPQIKIHHYRINVSQIWTPKVNKARKH